MKAPRVETDPPFGFSLALPITNQRPSDA